MKKPKTPPFTDADVHKLVDVLAKQHYGAAAKTTNGRVAPVLGFELGLNRDECPQARVLTYMIRRAWELERPLHSSPEGLFYAATPEEMQDCIDYWEYVIGKHQEAVNNMKKAKDAMACAGAV
jgi:hypothetical protein